MCGIRAKKSGLGGYGAGLLAALLGVSFLSQHAQTAEHVTNAANNTTIQIMKSTLSLSEGAWRLGLSLQYVARPNSKGRSMAVRLQGLSGGRGRPVCAYMAGTSVEQFSSTKTGYSALPTASKDLKNQVTTMSC
uniref:Serine protease 40 n=1 Tax=Mus musculus TaxID=10090 RepID=E9Q9Y0_MOUSE